MQLPGREPLLDAIKGSVLTLALFLAYVTFPLVGLMPGLFTSLPGIFYFLKSGAKTGAAILLLTISTLLLMGDKSLPLLYFFQSGLIAFLLPLFLVRSGSPARSIVSAVGINFLLIVILVIGYGLFSGANLQGLIIKGIETSSSQAIAIYEKQGVQGDDIRLLTDGIRQAGQFVIRVFPALLLVALGMIASLNMLLVFRLLAGRLPDLPKTKDFSKFRNPDFLIWVVIVAGFSMLLPYPDVSRVALNLLLVTCFAYLLQGMAVITAFFGRFPLPALARIFFWLAVALQPYLLLVVTVLGIFDIWGDFRTPKNKNL